MDVNAWDNLEGVYIDIFDTGKLFTNSPSVAYLDSIGGSANNTEIGTYGPASDFTYSTGVTQMHCAIPTTPLVSAGGRTSLATRNELKTELYHVLCNMYDQPPLLIGNSCWSLLLLCAPQPWLCHQRLSALPDHFIVIMSPVLVSI